MVPSRAVDHSGHSVAKVSVVVDHSSLCGSLCEVMDHIAVFLWLSQWSDGP